MTPKYPDSNHAKNGVADNGYVKFVIKNQTDKYTVAKVPLSVHMSVRLLAIYPNAPTLFSEDGKKLPLKFNC